MKKESIYIDKATAKRLGMKFYISQNECSNCHSKPSLRYTCNSCCISCQRKRYKKGEGKQ